MSSRWIVLLSGFLLFGCASTPKVCTPLESGGKGRLYYGQCLKLAYQGKDLTGNCLSEIVIQEDPGKAGATLRTVMFFIRDPKGTVSFHGIPTVNGFTGSSLLAMAVKSVNQPGKPHQLQSLRIGGICEVKPHPGGGNFIQCVTEEKGTGLTRGQFAALQEKPLSCREDFPEDLNLK